MKCWPVVLGFLLIAPAAMAAPPADDLTASCNVKIGSPIVLMDSPVGPVGGCDIGTPAGQTTITHIAAAAGCWAAAWVDGQAQPLAAFDSASPGDRIIGACDAGHDGNVAVTLAPSGNNRASG